MISTLNHHWQITQENLPEHIFNQFSLYISPSEAEQGLGIINTGEDTVCIEVGCDDTADNATTVNKGRSDTSSNRQMGRRNKRLATKSQPNRVPEIETESKAETDTDILRRDFANLGILTAGKEHNYSWSLNIYQNFGLLRSKEAKGTTGAVIWKVSYKTLQWLFPGPRVIQGPIKSKLAYDYKMSLFAPDSSIVELGCGISGIFSSTVGTKVSTYIATDQSHIIKHSPHNIVANVNKNQVYSTTISELADSNELSRRGKSRIEIVEYDWEFANEQIDRLKSYLPGKSSSAAAERFPNWVFASDTIYNSFLIPWFVDALKLICGPHTQILIAQQLRSGDIYCEFLETLLRNGFEIWAIGVVDDLDDTDRDSSIGNGDSSVPNIDAELLENGLLGKGYTLHYMRLSQK